MTKSTCSIDGCENPHRGHGWCNRHYLRWTRYGDPLGGGTSQGEPMRFYLAHVDDVTDDCILWPYGQQGGGYGVMYPNGASACVHVLACERFHGPKPDGMEVCHSCRNKHCFNPRHLRWGTSAENAADCARDGTQVMGERSNMAKLSEADVIVIRDEYASGSVSQRALAIRYGVTQSTIGPLLLRKTWQHVGG